MESQTEIHCRQLRASRVPSTGVCFGWIVPKSDSSALTVR